MCIVGILIYCYKIQVEIKRTIPKGAAPLKDFKTKKIFVGGLPSALKEGIQMRVIGWIVANLLCYFGCKLKLSTH